MALDYLGPLRSVADYKLVDKRFASDADAQKALIRAETAVNILDGIVADPAKRAAAVAEIRSRWP